MTTAHEAIARQLKAGVTHINGRGLGGRHDSSEKLVRYGDPHELLGDVSIYSTLKGKASLADNECKVLDQGPCGSCTGHGTVQCLACAQVLSFVASPLGLYRGIRCEERRPGADGSFPALTDSGGEPADIVTVVSTVGVKPIQAPTSDGRYSDCEPANVNLDPTLDELAVEAMTVEAGAYLVDMTSEIAAITIAAALDAGYVVGIAAFVDTAFENWGSGWSSAKAPIADVNLGDEAGGGHWICCNEYQTEADGSLTFAGPNSWSVLWGSPAMVATACPNAGGHYRVKDTWVKKAVAQAVIFKFGKAAPAAKKEAA